MENNGKKILWVSPTPTHPTVAGNRVHIRSLASFLRSQGLVLHFLYLAYEDYDVEALKAFWGEELYVVEKAGLFKKEFLPLYYINRIRRRLVHAARYFQRLTGKIGKQEYQYNTETDDHFPAAVAPFIKKLHQKNRYDIVICEYVFMSKALTLFDKHIFKILDTHDCFTNRFKVYLENNLEPSWVSLYKDQEKKALDRADLVISVQEKEKLYFESISSAKVIQYGYMPDVNRLPDRVFEQKLLYLAADNAINHLTLSYFIENMMPIITQQYPDMKLLVGGSVCKTFHQPHLNIEYMGEFKDAADFYSLGDIAINPEPKGTGYKIKTLEALAYGLPLVCTSVGAAGAIDPFLDHIFIADDPEAFAAIIGRLFNDPDLRRQTADNAITWITQYKERLRNNLLKNIPV